MTPVIGITMQAMERSWFGFQSTFDFVELINDNSNRSELGMIQFIHGKMCLPFGVVPGYFLSLIADSLCNSYSSKVRACKDFIL